MSGTRFRAPPTYGLVALGSGRQSGRDIGAVVDELGREVHIADVDVLAIHELLKMVADELSHFFESHAGVGHGVSSTMQLAASKGCSRSFADSAN